MNLERLRSRLAARLEALAPAPRSAPAEPVDTRVPEPTPEPLSELQAARELVPAAIRHDLERGLGWPRVRVRNLAEEGHGPLLPPPGGPLQ
jgi:hypothetical protein